MRALDSARTRVCYRVGSSTGSASTAVIGDGATTNSATSLKLFQHSLQPAQKDVVRDHVEDVLVLAPVHLEIPFLLCCKVVITAHEAIDPHVIARLGRVDADGGYHLLSMKSIRPACREIDEVRSTLADPAPTRRRPTTAASPPSPSRPRWGWSSCVVPCGPPHARIVL
jgi:hypothetical protein